MCAFLNVLLGLKTHLLGMEKVLCEVNIEF